MKVVVEEISGVRKKVSVEIPHERVDEELKKAYGLIKRQAHIKGFRPGKAPLNILKRYYSDRVESEVAQDLIRDSIEAALDESGVKPVSQPDVEKDEIREGSPFTYHLYADVPPEFELGEYKGLSLTKPLLEVADEDVENHLEGARQSHVKYETVEPERPLAADDVAVIDYRAFEDGEFITGVEGTDFHMRADSSYFSEGFDQALVGMSKGQEKEIVTDFPEDYPNPLLRGKKGVSFQVALKDIKARVMPELDDEFAKSLEFESLDELKKRVEEDLKEHAKNQAEAELRQNAGDALISLHEFEVPETLVDAESGRLLDNFYMNMARQGIDVKGMGMDEGALKERYREQAEKNVRLSFILKSVADSESIEVDEQELSERMKETAERMGPSFKLDDPEKRANLEEFLRESMLEEKALDFVIENAEVEEVPPGAQEDKGEDEDATDTHSGGADVEG